MKRLTTAVLTLALTVVLSHQGDAWLGAPASLQDSKVRTILYHPDQPIPPRLRDDDQTVVVARILDYFSSRRRATPPIMAELATSSATVAAIVRVGAVQAMLVENQSWINTRVEGSIEELFKGPPELGKTLNLEFFAHGGQMRLGKVLIKAATPPSITEGSTLLVFAYRMDDGTLLATYDPVMIQNGTMRSISHPDAPTEVQLTPLFGRILSSVIGNIRAAATRANPQ